MAATSLCEKQEAGNLVSSAAPSTLNIYLGVQVRALENKRSLLLVREGMTRVPGLGRPSAAASLENKEEHDESDVPPLSGADRDRWGTQLVTREMGTSPLPEGGKRMVRTGGEASVQALEEGKRTAPSPRPPRCSCPLPLPGELWENHHRFLEGALAGISFSSRLSAVTSFTTVPHNRHTWNPWNHLKALGNPASASKGAPNGPACASAAGLFPHTAPRTGRPAAASLVSFPSA